MTWRAALDVLAAGVLLQRSPAGSAGSATAMAEEGSEDALIETMPLV